jgi:hypothetical protein
VLLLSVLQKDFLIVFIDKNVAKCMVVREVWQLNAHFILPDSEQGRVACEIKWEYAGRMVIFCYYPVLERTISLKFYRAMQRFISFS